MNCGKRNRFVVKGKDAPFVVHNCQSIAFAALKYQALQIYKKGIPLSLNIHDEWVSVIPDELVERVALIFREAMTKSPPYFQKGLFDCEVSIGDNYADLKTFDFNNED